MDHAATQWLRGHPFRAAIAVVALAALSFGLWRGEIEYSKGWTGLQWLQGYPWSAFPICAIVPVAMLLPIGVAFRIEWRRAVAFWAFVSVVGWLSFEMTRRWFYIDNHWLAAAGLSPDWTYYVLSPVSAVALTTVGVEQAVHRLLLPIAPWTIALFLAAILLVVPLGLLSLQIAPAHGNRDFYHVVKSGYASFWVVVLLPAATAGAARFRSAPPAHR